MMNDDIASWSILLRAVKDRREIGLEEEKDF